MAYNLNQMSNRNQEAIILIMILGALFMVAVPKIFGWC